MSRLLYSSYFVVEKMTKMVLDVYGLNYFGPLYILIFIEIILDVYKKMIILIANPKTNCTNENFC